MRSLIDKFKNSEFAKSVALLFSGNSSAVLIPFLVAPLISRIYSPSDFAGFELFVKILMLFSLMGSLRFELAIIIPSEQRESDQITKLCFRILFIVVILSSILALFFNDALGAYLNNDDLPELLYWLPFGVLVFGTFNILNQVLVRFRKYKVLAANKVIATGTNNLTKYLIGLYHASPVGLIFGQLVGTLIPTLLYLKNKAVKGVLFSNSLPVLSQKELIRKYKDFPLVNSTHVLVDELSKTAFFFALSAYFGEIVFGLFAFTFRYLRVPIQVTGTSLAQVLNERLARMNSEGRPIAQDVKKMILFLALLGIFPFSLLFFYGEPIFSFVFSESWARAGYFAQLIAPWLYLNFVVSPISMLPIILNKQKQYLLVSTLMNVSVLIALFLTSKSGFKVEMVISYVTAVYVIFNVFLVFWFIRISGSGTQNANY